MSVSSGTSSPEQSRTKDRKTIVVVVVVVVTVVVKSTVTVLPFRCTLTTG